MSLILSFLLPLAFHQAGYAPVLEESVFSGMSPFSFHSLSGSTVSSPVAEVMKSGGAALNQPSSWERS
ncbi:hypothetical protein RHGRI_028458 [Rhododendron griersonianum]|uniref:Uncharacterized protein n=1 Tax=Rhododendron griersonianum TaxID=479676 RepID=A0AAV6ILU8_9ERIC|nr:hypothetical protein RHGRI_028458 [Rhododendron griersonianum]